MFWTQLWTGKRLLQWRLVFLKKCRVSDRLFHLGIFHLWRCQVSPMPKRKGTHPASTVTWVAHNTFPSPYKRTKSQTVAAHRYWVWNTKWRIEGQCRHFLFLHACWEQDILQTLQCRCSLQSLGVKTYSLRDRVRHWLTNHEEFGIINSHWDSCCHKRWAERDIATTAVFVLLSSPNCIHGKIQIFLSKE